MKKLYIFIVSLCLVIAASGQQIPEPMQPLRLVNDFTGLLSSQEQSLLEQKLRNYNDTTSTQIYIVTVSDLSGDDIADFAFKLFNKWQIGQKNKNNGLLILIHPGEGNVRGDIFINTGYGLEGAIPDAAAFQIINRYLKPAFIEGNFYKGLDDATTVIMKLASGEFTADDLEETPPIIGIIIFAMFIIAGLYLLSKNSSGKGGGGFTGGSVIGGLGGLGGFGSGGGRRTGGGFGGFGGGGGGLTGGGGARGGW